MDGAFSKPVSAAGGNSGWEGKMAETANKRGIPRYVVVAVVILVACVVAAGVTLFLRDRNEKEMLSQLERSQADLRMRLYEQARERDSHRGWLDLERLRGRHHPETWEQMSEIIGLAREINEVTKRQISVVHAMASLPEPESVCVSGMNSSCRLPRRSTHSASNFRLWDRAGLPTPPSSKFLKRWTESSRHLCRLQLALTLSSLQI